MLLGMRSLWSAYLFLTQTKPSDMYLGSIQRRKECGGYEKRNVFVMFLFLLLARESAGEKGGHPWKRTDMCLDLWKNRKIACGLSMFVSLPLAGLVN